MIDNTKKIRLHDRILNTITYVFSSFELIILILILFFIFSNGLKGFSFKMLVSDYYEKPYFASCTKTIDYEFELVNNNGVYYSTKWGIGLKESKDFSNNDAVEIVYIDNLSPLRNAKNISNSTHADIKVGQIIKRIQVKNEDGSLSILTTKDKAEKMVLALDQGVSINEIYYSTIGGGIRGSLITTFYLIVLTLIIALPLGIMAAIYLSQYAPNNRFTNLIRSLIDMTSGIPSIIFGLIGMIVFIPFVNSISNRSGGSIVSGALTLSIMLLPIIIRTTEESINAIPSSYKMASLGLGASYVQTMFKIIIPSALPGIITSIFLSIGRIIGESAALIFAVGTSIKDNISIFGSSTSLAVHIWTSISGEKPNLEHACAISIIILSVVLILNIAVKLFSNKLLSKGGR